MSFAPLAFKLFYAARHNLLDDIGRQELQSSEEFLLCQLRQLPRTVNGTGHTGPSEFCATSI